MCSLSRKGLYFGAEEAFNTGMALVNVLYDSDNFCVAEFAAGGGIYPVDTHPNCSGYFEGHMAARLRTCKASLRSDEEDERIVKYIRDNPAKAGLGSEYGAWPYAPHNRSPSGEAK